MRELWASSLSQLFEIVFGKNNTFFYEPDLFIFRGQADSTWGLVPSAFRGYKKIFSDTKYEVRDHSVVDKGKFFATGRITGLEQKIYDEFFERIRGYPLARMNHLHPWEMLCLAQHFRVPTRLLDWTSNLSIAAYLCVAEIVRDEKGVKQNGAIWCLNATLIANDQNPRGENDSSSGLFNDKEARISRIDELPWATSFFPARMNRSESSKDSGYGFRVLRAPAIDDRIKSQGSYFTVEVTKSSFTRKEEDITTHFDQAELCEDYLLKIVIPADAKESIKENLEKLGTDYSVIFPDLDGLGKFFEDFRKVRIPAWMLE